MPKKTSQIEDRKLDGIQITLKENVQARGATTLLEDVTLINNSLPELNLEDINTETTFLSHKFSAPLLIEAMTGGTKEAGKINGNLATAAEALGLGMGVGSQRAALDSEAAAETYSIARKNAPNAFLVANIGGAQLSDLKVEDIRRLIDMIKADALAIHLNPLQELVQPEGEPRFRGVWDRISQISREVGTPVIVKEVGCGISREVATKLEIAGVSAIDVAGVGGTSWAAVEHFRALKRNLSEKAMLGELFWNWGIPTAASIIEVKKAVRLPIVASGGVRTGLDMAKCIALGARITGMAQPILAAAIKSDKDVAEFLQRAVDQLKATMLITGARDVRALGNVRYLVTGRLSDWKKMSQEEIRY